ncbi:unnamed protein product [Calicophoron daubneyi]|uniref:Mitochondrial ornithine transporter 1 n=1 Tax=Calicophoron daubneyi TaxID=300641 RepID=A0AAV2TH88_CALDB
MGEDIKDMVVGTLAGINGGIATVYVGQPLDTIKVKMQAFPELYKSTWECVKITLAKDGIVKGLYAGTSPAVFANAAENAILFCALPPCQDLVRKICSKKDTEELSNLQHAFAGSLASVWSGLVMCPTELVKCRVQAMREMMDLGLTTIKPANSGSWSVTRAIFREEGLLGFTRGLGATLVRELPGYFCFFGSYELCRSFFAGQKGRKEDVGPVATAFSGGVAGAMLWIACYPFDLIKSRLQIGHTSPEPTHQMKIKSPVSYRASNVFAIMFRVIEQEGFFALYRGLGATLVRTIPATAGLFVAVEWTRKFCRWISD